jgi:cytochrome c oxidase cbb3-type subunit 3
MNHRAVLLAVFTLGTTACGIRDAAPGQPPLNLAVIRPDKILDFDVLYAENCAGCHGSDGKGGIAISLGDPEYLAIADDAVVRTTTSNGVTGTSMPAFAQSSGGQLTAQQIEAIVGGIRTHWAKPDVLRGANPPPYTAEGSGDPQQGANVYDVYCSSCHGAGGRGGSRASSIVDPSYLSLVSAQNLRTTVIVGRPELGAPDWRGDVPGKPMSSQDVSDVVAWLGAQRPQVSATLAGGK